MINTKLNIINSLWPRAWNWRSNGVREILTGREWSGDNFHQHFTYEFFVRTSFFYVHVTRKSCWNTTFVRKICTFNVDEIDYSIRSTGSTTSWMSSESGYTGGASIVSEGSNQSFVMEVSLVVSHAVSIFFRLAVWTVVLCQ